MDREKTKKNIRGAVLRFAAVFFITILILTFFSKTVEQLLLPEVTTFTPQPEAITNKYTFNAFVSYEKTAKAYPYFDTFIEKVLVEKDQEVDVGTPIAKLRDYDVAQKKDEYNIQILSLQNDFASLQDSLKGRLPKALKDSLKRQLEIVKTNLEAKEREKALWFSSIDSEDRLLSSVKGRIINVTAEDQSHIDITSPLFEYLDGDSYAVIRWKLPPEKASQYGYDSSADIDYLYFGTNASGMRVEKTETKIFQIDDITYDGSDGQYVFKTRLDNSNAYLLTSPKITLTLAAKPVNIAQAVPSSAIFNDGPSSGKVIYVIGEDFQSHELTVSKRPVHVIKDYGIYSEVDVQFGSDDQIVLSSTQPLSDNMKVKKR